MNISFRKEKKLDICILIIKGIKKNVRKHILYVDGFDTFIRNFKLKFSEQVKKIR